MILGVIKVLFFSNLIFARPTCSSVLPDYTIHSFKRGFLRNRKMVYQIDRPHSVEWNGKTIIFPPGFSKGKAFWNRQASYYEKKGYQIFRYDPFNIGHTLKENGVLRVEEGLSFEDDINAVAQILKSKGIDKEIIIVGHSLGSAKAVFLERVLNKKSPGSVEKLFITAPFVRFLSDYYSEKQVEELVNPFLIWNPFKEGSFFSDQTELINQRVKGFGEAISAANSSSLPSVMIDVAMTNALIDEALSHKIEDEYITGLEESLEKEALFEVMKSLTEVSVLTSVGKVSAEMHLLTGHDDEVIVPLGIIKELVENAPETMSSTQIRSGHYVTKTTSFYRWLNSRL